jgi:hypothetical protein
LKPTSVAAGIVIYNSFTPAEGTEQAFHDWYENEYIPAVKQIPGFHRTRRYKLEEAVVSGLKKAEVKPAPNYLEVSGTSRLSASCFLFFFINRCCPPPVIIAKLEFETLSDLHGPKFPNETAGQEVISTATATERRVFKLLRSFEPTAALRSLRTPSAVAPSSSTSPS